MTVEFDLVSLQPLNLPPVEKYIPSNQPPTPFERAQLQELLRQSIDVRRQLDIRRTEVELYAKKLEIALAPCKILSSDVWAVVFGLIPGCRWVLSWACRAWREIALSMSSLWATLPAMGHPTVSAENFFRCIETHRSRARSRSLIVSELRLPPAFGFKHDDLQAFILLFREMIPSI